MVMNLTTNYYEIASVIIFGIGFTTLLLNKNLIKKIIGLNFMDGAIYLFITARGYVAGGNAPIIVDGMSESTIFVNPLPSGLVLTGIVVSVSTTAFLLALAIKLYDHYHTLDTDEIFRQMRKEDE